VCSIRWHLFGIKNTRSFLFTMGKVKYCIAQWMFVDFMSTIFFYWFDIFFRVYIHIAPKVYFQMLFYCKHVAQLTSQGAKYDICSIFKSSLMIIKWVFERMYIWKSDCNSLWMHIIWVSGTQRGFLVVWFSGPTKCLFSVNAYKRIKICLIDFIIPPLVHHL